MHYRIAVLAVLIVGCTAAPPDVADTSEAPVAEAIAPPVVTVLAGHQPVQDGAAISLHNPVHGLIARFDARGVRIVGIDRPFDWHWRFHGPEVAPRIVGDRVEYDRGHLVEWYLNTSQGFEQGFDVLSPDGLALSGDVTGDLDVTPKDDGATLAFEGAGGLMTVSNLFARDADGVSLPTQLSWDAPVLSFEIDDANATYPIAVDPLLGDCPASWCSDGDPSTQDICHDYGATCDRVFIASYEGQPCTWGEFCCPDWKYHATCSGVGLADCPSYWCNDGDPSTLQTCSGFDASAGTFDCDYAFDSTYEGQSCTWGDFCCPDGTYRAAGCASGGAASCPAPWCNDGDPSTIETCTTTESGFDCEYAFDSAYEGQPCFWGAFCCEDDGKYHAVCGGFCGDGILAPPEDCDDGAANDDATPDACRTDCTLARCGDGVVDTGDDCDDGAGNSDTIPDACRTDCTLAGCGDGVVDAGEPCDDGAGNSDTTPDACRVGCILPTCGDGVVDTGEGCDDGAANNDVDPGACRTDCEPAGCGDGVLEPGEHCDDGNTVGGDGCGQVCQREHRQIRVTAASFNGELTAPFGAFTTPFASGPGGADARCEAEFGSGWQAVLGQSAVRTAIPALDWVLTPFTGYERPDGTFVGVTDERAVFQFPLTAPISPTVGSAWTGLSTTFALGAGCDAWTVGFSGVFGADGTVGVTNAVTFAAISTGGVVGCSALRQLYCVEVTPCGDGVLDPGEQCDDGAGNSDVAADACRTTCVVPNCGDGVVDAGEECDDGNRVAGDGCDGACVTEALYIRQTVATTNGEIGGIPGADALCQAEFGPDYVALMSDEVARSRQFDADWVLLPGQPYKNGDGRLVGVADTGGALPFPLTEALGTGPVWTGLDGNFDDADTCAGWTDAGATAGGAGEAAADTAAAFDAGADPCFVSKSLYCVERPLCGNYVVDPGESCDSGALQNSDTAPDACRLDCTEPFCGDGTVDTDEECDDAGANSDTTPDACRENCVAAACGDAIQDSGEQCDDANAIPADGCTACDADNLRIHVTSGTWRGNLSTFGAGTNGVDGADNLCRAEFGSEFRALIMDGTTRTATVDWVLQPTTTYQSAALEVIGTTNASAVFTFELEAAMGTGGDAWTGMSAFWTPSSDCNDWQNQNSGAFGATGNRGRTNQIGTSAIAAGGVGCGTANRLICVEQP